MRTPALLLLALPLLSPAPVAAAKVTREALSFKGKEHRYALYVPDRVASTADSAAKAPLVFVLHQGRDDADDMVGRWRNLADDEGFVVVGPQSLDKAAWSFIDEPPALFRRIVDTLAARLPIDPRRVYLFGHWDGGDHAMCTGLIESEYFAAVAVHASALPPGLYGWLDLHRRKIPFQLQAGNQRQKQSLRLEVVRATEEQMRRRDLPVEVAVLRGHDNFYGDLSGKINRLAWEFLRRHSLPADPLFRDVQIQFQVQH